MWYYYVSYDKCSAKVILLTLVRSIKGKQFLPVLTFVSLWSLKEPLIFQYLKDRLIWVVFITTFEMMGFNVLLKSIPHMTKQNNDSYKGKNFSKFGYLQVTCMRSLPSIAISLLSNKNIIWTLEYTWQNSLCHQKGTEWSLARTKWVSLEWIVTLCYHISLQQIL